MCIIYAYDVFLIDVLPATGYPGYSVWSHLKVIVELSFALDLGSHILPFSYFKTISLPPGLRYGLLFGVPKL